MKLIDCFMYFDEDVVLDLRLNILKDIVDKFVIVESRIDHAGNTKKLNFDLNKFKSFKDKITYLVADDLPFKRGILSTSWRNKPSWLRENFQRNYLLNGFNKSHDEDIIMISDIDEIPNPDTINNFNKEKKYACFIQKNFQSKLNLLNLNEPNWYGTRICVKKFLKSPQWLRNIKIKKKSFWKFYRTPMPQLIENGGWHFSFLKDSSQISSKLKSYAHQEYNNDKINKVELIEEKLKKREDILGRNFYYKPVKIDSSFPKHILENINKLDKWIV